MSAQQPATPRQMYFYGALAAATGLYFMLVGFGVLATPGGPRNLHAPLWVVQLVGLVFVLAGAAIVIQAMGHANGSGELPADAPQWMRAAQYFIGVVVFACFALIGSWVAIGGEFAPVFRRHPVRLFLDQCVARPRHVRIGRGDLLDRHHRVRGVGRAQAARLRQELTPPARRADEQNVARHFAGVIRSAIAPCGLEPPPPRSVRGKTVCRSLTTAQGNAKTWMAETSAR